MKKYQKSTHPRYYPRRILRSTINALSPNKKCSAPPPVDELSPRLRVSPPMIMRFPTLDPVVNAVELSNYPPNLKKSDVQRIFSGFYLADFEMPSMRSFSVPLRAKIHISGRGEAERAVFDLNGMNIEGKKISVKLVERTSFEEREILMDEVAGEIKAGIIDAAKLLSLNLQAHVVQVRELMTRNSYYSFLQYRLPFITENMPEDVDWVQNGCAEWVFVAAGSADTRKREGRVQALRDLQQVVARQLEAFDIWSHWEGCEDIPYE